MSKIWEEYKHIRRGDFLKWRNKKTAKEKLDWNKTKDRIDLEIEKDLWERELRRKL